MRFSWCFGGFFGFFSPHTNTAVFTFDALLEQCPIRKRKHSNCDLSHQAAPVVKLLREHTGSGSSMSTVTRTYCVESLAVEKRK